MSKKIFENVLNINSSETKVAGDVEQDSRPVRSRARRRLIKAFDVFIIIVVLAAGVYGYAYFSSPEVIRNPKLEHYHFRMQIIIDGKPENFGSEGYQTGYAKDQCNANLPEQPIHFHDNKDQFTHIHWEGITGGMVMKYYGWNYIGGMSNALGYKLNDLGDIQEVTTHGNFLPRLESGAQTFIYSGDSSAYSERSFEDWKNQDLEVFFNTTSNFPAHELNKQKTSFSEQLLPTASAQEDSSIEDETELEELTRINNLIGNVVIFVQSEKPNDEQVKARFNNLEPLSDSTCGG